MNVHGHSWNSMVKNMDLRFNDMEVHRLPCESIIGHQCQWAIRLGWWKSYPLPSACSDKIIVFLCRLSGILMEIYLWIAMFTSKIIRPPPPLPLHCKDRKFSPDWLHPLLCKTSILLDQYILSLCISIPFPCGLAELLQGLQNPTFCSCCIVQPM